MTSSDQPCYYNFERLFLMEFMINKVQYCKSTIKLNQDLKESLGETCVKIKFKDYPVLEICEEDFVSGSKPNDEIVTFKSGKSCLFSLRQQQVTFGSCFEVIVTVCRKVRGKKPDEYCVLGEAKINLASSFTDLLMQDSHSPACRIVKNNFKLHNYKSEIIGNISIFIRLSSFGNMILTQFQLIGEENSSFLFKGTSDIEQFSPVKEHPSGNQTFRESKCAPKSTQKMDKIPQYRSAFEMQACREMYNKNKYPEFYRAPYDIQSEPCGAGARHFGINVEQVDFIQRQLGIFPQFEYGQGRPDIDLELFNLGQGQFDVSRNPFDSFPICPPPGGAVCGTQPYGAPVFLDSLGRVPVHSIPADLTAGGLPVYSPPSAGIPPTTMVGSTMPQEVFQAAQDFQGHLCDTDPEDYELEGDYKVLSAEVNGYALKIKLLKRPKKKSD